MSHLTTIRTAFVNREALFAAGEALGHPLIEGGQARYYSGLSGECDLLMKLPGRYDLGFKREDDGKFAAVCDSEVLTGSYGRSDAARQILGENLARFKQEYAAAVAQQFARKSGFAYSRREADVSRGEQRGAVYVTLTRSMR